MSHTRESVAAEELYEALLDYAAKGNTSPRVRTTLGGWVHFSAIRIVRFGRFTIGCASWPARYSVSPEFNKARSQRTKN